MPKNASLFILLALLSAACASCARKETAPSLVLVTYGYAPASCFGSAAGEPSLTPVFDSLSAKGLVRQDAPQSSGNPAAAARRLVIGGGETLPQALQTRGYRTAAFVADPALAGAAESFGEWLAPDEAVAASNRMARTRAWLAPSPFEQTRYERFLRGEVAMDRAIGWLAKESRAEVSSKRLNASRQKASGRAVRGQLKHPVFLWVHLADPVFQGSPEHVRVTGAKTTRQGAEVAYMDLQLGRLVEFLAASGLRDSVALAVVGLHGDPQTAEELADESPDAAWRIVAALVPAAGESGKVPAVGDVCTWIGLERNAIPPAEETAAVEMADAERRALELRLRRPSAEDETLEADCRAYAEANPENADAWCWLGVAQLLAKKPAEALESQRKAFELEPKSAFRMSNLGLAHLEVGEVAPAIDQLENAYLADPSSGLYKANLAAVLLRVGVEFTRQKQYEDASACLTRVVLLQPRNPHGHFAMGRLQEALGRRELAESSYKKALDLNPNYAPAKASLRRLSEGTGGQP